MRIIDPEMATLLRALSKEAPGHLELVSKAIANASHGRKAPSLDAAKAELEKLKLQQEHRTLPAPVW